MRIIDRKTFNGQLYLPSVAVMPQGMQAAATHLETGAAAKGSNGKSTKWRCVANLDRLEQEYEEEM